MTIPASGQIGMSTVNVEIGLPWNANIWLDHGAIRALAGINGSGTRIGMDSLRGKSGLSVRATGEYNSGQADGVSRTAYATARAYITGTYTGIEWEVISHSMGSLPATKTGTTLQLSLNVKYGGNAYARVRARVWNGTTTVYSNEVDLQIEYWYGQPV